MDTDGPARATPLTLTVCTPDAELRYDLAPGTPTPLTGDVLHLYTDDVRPHAAGLRVTGHRVLTYYRVPGVSAAGCEVIVYTEALEPRAGGPDSPPD